MTVPRRTIRAGTLWLFGCAALATVYLLAEIPEGVDPGPIAIGLISNILFIGLATAIGAATAYRCGLFSLIATNLPDAGKRLRSFPAYAIVGILIGLSVAGLDKLLFSEIPALAELLSTHEATFKKVSQFSRSALATRIAYGGVVEEILLRWGVLSLLAWLILVATKRRKVAISVAIIVSAILFGVGHLPATYQIFGNPPIEMITRVVVLNGALGILFGAVFARNSLEAAMVCHAAVHIGLLTSPTTVF